MPPARAEQSAVANRAVYDHPFAEIHRNHLHQHGDADHAKELKDVFHAEGVPVERIVQRKIQKTDHKSVDDAERHGIEAVIFRERPAEHIGNDEQRKADPQTRRAAAFPEHGAIERAGGDHNKHERDAEPDLHHRLRTVEHACGGILPVLVFVGNAHIAAPDDGQHARCVAAEKHGKRGKRCKTVKRGHFPPEKRRQQRDERDHRHMHGRRQIEAQKPRKRFTLQLRKSINQHIRFLSGSNITVLL